jgi:hypothetical protein
VHCGASIAGRTECPTPEAGTKETGPRLNRRGFVFGTASADDPCGRNISSLRHPDINSARRSRYAARWPTELGYQISDDGRLRPFGVFAGPKVKNVAAIVRHCDDVLSVACACAVDRDQACNIVVQKHDFHACKFAAGNWSNLTTCGSPGIKRMW